MKQKLAMTIERPRYPAMGDLIYCAPPCAQSHGQPGADMTYYGIVVEMRFQNQWPWRLPTGPGPHTCRITIYAPWTQDDLSNEYGIIEWTTNDFENEVRVLSSPGWDENDET